MDLERAALLADELLGAHRLRAQRQARRGASRLRHRRSASAGYPLSAGSGLPALTRCVVFAGQRRHARFIFLTARLELASHLVTVTIGKQFSMAILAQ